MPMTREQKATLLIELDQTLGTAKGVVFANYQGLKVKDSESLRRSLHEANMTMRVTKNTILGLVLRRHQITIDETILDQPLVMIASADDELAPAKALKTFTKEHEAMEIIGGLLGDQYLPKQQVLKLADLPSQDQLRAQLVGVLASPLSRLVRTLSAPLAGLVNVLQQYKEQRT